MEEEEEEELEEERVQLNGIFFKKHGSFKRSILSPVCSYAHRSTNGDFAYRAYKY